MGNSLYKMCLQEIMAVVFMKTNIQSKMCNTATVPKRSSHRGNLPLLCKTRKRLTTFRGLISGGLVWGLGGVLLLELFYSA